MNDLISREEALMCLTGEYLEGQEYKLDDEICKFIKRMQNVPTVPAIPITENATNGDMIMAMFPKSGGYEYAVEKDLKIATMFVFKDGQAFYVNFDLDWWNAPYKRGDTE